MMGIRRAAFRLLLGASILLCVWWLFHVPYRADAVYRAVPAGVPALGLHLDLPSRWQETVRNPLTAGLLASAGLDGDTLQAAVQDPAVARAVRWAAPRQLLWARVPWLDGAGPPAWMFASWLGGRSQVLRWMLQVAPPESFARRTLPFGGTYWVVETKEATGGLTAQFALVEGMLLGCLSSDEHGILSVVDGYRGRRPSLLTRGMPPPRTGACAPGSTPDSGWVRFDGKPGRTWPPARVAYAFETLSASNLVGTLCAPVRLSGGAVAGAGEEVPIEFLPHERPIAAAMFSPSSAPSLFRGLDPMWADVFTWLQDEAAGPVCLKVLGNAFGGRYLGLKVPTVFLSLPVKNAEQADRTVRKVLDLVNARYQTGLVPRRMPAGRRTVMGFERVVDGTNHRLTLRERPGYVVIDKTLVVASNLDGLIRVLSAAEGDLARNGRGSERWRQFRGRAEAQLCGWLDLSRGATILRTLLKFHAGRLQATDPAEAGRMRATLDAWSGWLTALEPMGTCSFSLTGDDAGTQLVFSTGENAP